MKYLIANWKAEMTLTDIENWVVKFKQQLKSFSSENVNKLKSNITVLLCPSHIFIERVKNEFADLPFIAIGSQTVSEFTKGKHTGEETAEALKDYASYSIIGHSERRRDNNLSEQQIEKQLANCQSANIAPILCIRDSNDKIHSNVNIISYEPVFAIGTGTNASVDSVLEFKKSLNISPEISFIYGGSVDERNISEYIATNEVDGYLVGSASLDPDRFFSMLSQIAKSASE